MISNFIKALELAAPGIGWSVKGERVFSNIIWDNPEEAISQEDFELALEQVSSLSYREQRAVEYPSIGDQLDSLFHAGLFPEEMAAKIQEVKDRYPK
jgi:hypothetical protein